MSALPDDIDKIMDYIGMEADGYGYLKWNEEAKLKADMMLSWRYWSAVEPAALREKCIAVGLSAEDTATVLDFLERRRDGRRLIPQASYRDFQFTH